MPTVLRVEGFRFFFYSNEGDEPVHVHVEKGEGYGKIWLEPDTRVAYMFNFTVREQRQILGIVQISIAFIKHQWHEHFE
jgi:hypothetical protein